MQKQIKLSPFRQKVLQAVAKIPRGKVSTYALIARHIGHPGAARAVGTALAKNPTPINIPCHRVICSDGRLGNYQGGSTMKKALLEKEGVIIRGEKIAASTVFFASSTS
ncbi:MAG: MGMT family protein [Candidatus Margulisiibacteriota bacterium]